jgi:hypothetical protein
MARIFQGLPGNRDTGFSFARPDPPGETPRLYGRRDARRYMPAAANSVRWRVRLARLIGQYGKRKIYYDYTIP